METIEFSVVVHAQPPIALTADEMDDFSEAMAVYHGSCSYVKRNPTFSCRFTVIAKSEAAAVKLGKQIFKAAALACGLEGRMVLAEAEPMAALAN